MKIFKSHEGRGVRASVTKLHMGEWGSKIGQKMSRVIWMPIYMILNSTEKTLFTFWAWTVRTKCKLDCKKHLLFAIWKRVKCFVNHRIVKYFEKNVANQIMLTVLFLTQFGTQLLLIIGCATVNCISDNKDRFKKFIPIFGIKLQT